MEYCCIILEEFSFLYNSYQISNHAIKGQNILAGWTNADCQLAQFDHRGEAGDWGD
jgi:hypothetical protein